MMTLIFNEIVQKHQQRLILDRVSLSLTAGECTLLTGDNGAGKTTLLRILAGIDKPQHFQVETCFDVLNWRQYRRVLGKSIVYLHQQPYLFEGSVQANLAYVVKRFEKPLQQGLIQQALAWAGLEHLAHSRAKHLSGGEYQRVALARAWLRRPKILLLDEPTANMDQDARLRTLNLLQQLRNEQITLLIASHDPDYFNTLKQQHVHLAHGHLQHINSTVQSATIIPFKQNLKP